MVDIKFAKLREEAVIPSKREGDGCYDIYACDENDIIIQPHEVKLVPTGICSNFPNNYRIGIRERGSNTKGTLIVMAGQIDASYTGEWFCALYNGNSIPVEISKNVIEVEKTVDYIRIPYHKAIAQFAIEEVPNSNIIEVSLEEIQSIVTERGSGCLGSSNK